MYRSNADLHTYEGVDYLVLFLQIEEDNLE